MNALKICLVTEPSGGGSGRHVLDLARGLIERGHSVTLTWSPDRAEPAWVEAVRSEPGLTQQPIPMQRAVGLHDMTSLRALARYLKAAGPFDVLHAHSSKAGALVRLLPRSVSGHRLYTPHALVTMDPGLSAMKRRIYGMAERRLARKSGTLIAVSEAEYRHAHELGLSGNIVRIVNGFRPVSFLDRSEARRRLGVNEDGFAVGFVGRLADQKNPERFVRIIEMARQKSSKVTGVIIGDGERAGALKAAEPKGINFLGWQDAPPLLSGLDLFLMTSRYEAMPYTLIEALSAGLPIVSTRVGGVEEAVDPGRNGYVFDQDADDHAIAGAITEIADDPALQTRYSEASKAMSAAYTVDKMVESTLDLYGSLGHERPKQSLAPAGYSRQAGYKV